MIRIDGIDHLSLTVSNFKRSKKFYEQLLKFMGFKLLDEYDDSIGWTNGKTRIWLSAADPSGVKRKYRAGDVGFEHYAFQLRSRKDVYALQVFLENARITIVNPAGEYYEDYYAVYFLDPDGMKFEGMHYGKK